MVRLMTAATYLSFIALRSSTCTITFPDVSFTLAVCPTPSVVTVERYVLESLSIVAECSYCAPVSHVFSPVCPYFLARASKSAPPFTALYMLSAFVLAASAVSAPTCITRNCIESGICCFEYRRMTLIVLSALFSTGAVTEPTAIESRRCAISCGKASFDCGRPKYVTCDMLLRTISVGSSAVASWLAKSFTCLLIELRSAALAVTCWATNFMSRVSSICANISFSSSYLALMSDSSTFASFSFTDE